MASRLLGRIGVAVLVAFFLAAGLGEGQTKDKKRKTYPRQVLLIRHAEKPPDEDDSVHITDRGKGRAESLYRLFRASDERPSPFPTPDFIFAARDSKHSHRSTETVAPLAKRLKVTVNASYENDDFVRLADEVFRSPKYAGKTVLICWHHGKMPDLARRLEAADAPDSWKGAVFDRVWQIEYGEGGKASFRDRPQRLLEGDSKK